MKNQTDCLWCHALHTVTLQVFYNHVPCDIDFVPISPLALSTDLTIPEAVNMIMVVSVAQLRELGRNLGLEESDHEAISYSYDVKEHHQRLIEKWFDQKPKRSREMLIEALPGRDSSVLMIGVLPTPPPEPLIGKQNKCMIRKKQWRLAVATCVYMYVCARERERGAEKREKENS